MLPRLVMPPDCTLAQSTALQVVLTEGLADLAGDTLTIDATDVQDADISFAQLLVSARKTAETEGVSIVLEPSPAVEELLGCCGVLGLFLGSLGHG